MYVGMYVCMYVQGTGRRVYNVVLSEMVVRTHSVRVVCILRIGSWMRVDIADGECNLIYHTIKVVELEQRANGCGSL